MNKQERSRSPLLACQSGSDQPLRLLRAFGSHDTWSPKLCQPWVLPSGCQAVFSRWVPLRSLPPRC